MSVQDEARSFRSKVEAIRFMTKNILSRHAFQQYLEEHHVGVQYLLCFIDLDDIKAVNDDKLIPQTTLLLSKYQALCEQAEKSVVTDPANNAVINLWEKLRRIRTMDMKKTTRKDLLATVTAVQNQILGELATPFEEFLESSLYKVWQENQMKAEKELQGKQHSHPRAAHPHAPGEKASIIITSSGKWLSNNPVPAANATGGPALSPTRPAAAQNENIDKLTSVVP